MLEDDEPDGEREGVGVGARLSDSDGLRLLLWDRVRVVAEMEQVALLQEGVRLHRDRVTPGVRLLLLLTVRLRLREDEAVTERDAVVRVGVQVHDELRVWEAVAEGDGVGDAGVAVVL